LSEVLAEIFSSGAGITCIQLRTEDFCLEDTRIQDVLVIFERREMLAVEL
jgi:hypothetical protein